VVKSPENTFFMTSSHSKVSALFSMVLQLNVQNGKGGRKVMWIKSSRDFFFLILAICTSILILSVWNEPQKFTCIVIVYLLGMTEAI